MNKELEKIESWLQEQVTPLANTIDRESEVLRSLLKQMGDRSWLALKADLALGGKGLSELDYRRLQISFARASGALAFLQTQHQSAVSKLAQSDNQSLRQEFFPDVAQGIVLLGVGFSHLRRRQPIMRARQTNEGYVLTGEIPWITGYGYFDYFILGATLADGRELYGVLPLKNSVQELGGEISFSEPMKLLAVGVTNTVSAKINQWFLNRDRLVSINPPGKIHQSSKKNILNQGFFALGCAYAGLDILQNIAKTKQLKFLGSSWQALSQEVKLIENKAIAKLATGTTLISEDEAVYAKRLRLRIETIDLAQRCSLAAVIASSGAANYLYSSAGRVYREALLFSVSGHTTDVMEASLKHLLSKEDRG